MKNLIIRLIAISAIIFLSNKIANAQTPIYTIVQAQGQTLKLTPAQIKQIQSIGTLNPAIKALTTSIKIGSTIKYNTTADLILALHKKV